MADANAVAPPPAGYTAGRHRTFSALVETYKGQENSLITTAGFDPSEVFERLYAEQPRINQAYVDGLLDAIETAPQDAPFSRLSIEARRREIRSWYAASDPLDARVQLVRDANPDEPTDLRRSNERQRSAILQQTKMLSEADTSMDPTTLLSRFDPEPATPAKPLSEHEMGLETRVLQLRQLRFEAYRMICRPITDDRDLLDTVVFK